MDSNLKNLSILIDKLEQALKQDGLWQIEPATQYQLSSLEPFAVDRLSPEQWLQWIFLPTMRNLVGSVTKVSQLDKNLANIAITPYLEVSFKDKIKLEYKHTFNAVLELENYLKECLKECLLN